MTDKKRAGLKCPLIKISLVFIFLLSFTFIVVAEDFGYNYIEGDLNIAQAVNYTQINVNDSNYWDGNAWNPNRWLNTDGSNANQNINIGSYNFSIDTNTLFVDSDAKRIGIRTSTPSEALDVHGRITTDSQVISGNAFDSAIIGGELGTINHGFADKSVIAGGYSNTIRAKESFIGGGYACTIGSTSSRSAIVSGWSNTIDGVYGFIGGGRGNRIYDGSTYGLILGGYVNSNNATYSAIIGGNSNRILAGHNNVVMLACNDRDSNKGNTAYVEDLTAFGDVGIGTTNPQNTLNVVGDINATGLVYGMNIFSENSKTQVGINAGLGNIGTQLTALGYRSAENNEGLNLIAIGYQSAEGNEGSNDIFIGMGAGRDNPSPGAVGIGINALGSNTGLFSETAVGYYAGYQNTGNHVAFVGENAGEGNDGMGNVGMGRFACREASGSSLVCIGHNSGSTGISTSYNTLVGTETGGHYLGLYSTGIGANALNIAKGEYLTAVGGRAGNVNLGHYLTAIGYEAGRWNEGNSSVFVGNGAGKGNLHNNLLMIHNEDTSSDTPLIWGNFSSGNLVIDSNVTADYFIGDGSQLTGITSGGGFWNRTGTNTYLTNLNDNVGIGTATPSAKLDVEVTSGGSATIGNDGCSATGDFAFATGYDATASGDYSIAMGRGTTASERYATAIGLDSTASGRYSTARGVGTTASETQATAMGHNTIASGQTSTSMGETTVASGQTSMVIGSYTHASGSDSFTGGRNMQPTQGDGTFVWGFGASAQNFAPADKRFLIFPQGEVGRVGIGTTNPQNTLNVVGDINATGSIYGDGSQLTGISGGIWTNNSGTAEFEGNIDTTKDEWGIWSNNTCIVIGNTSMRSYC